MTSLSLKEESNLQLTEANRQRNLEHEIITLHNAGVISTLIAQTLKITVNEVNHRIYRYIVLHTDSSYNSSEQLLWIKKHLVFKLQLWNQFIMSL